VSTALDLTVVPSGANGTTITANETAWAWGLWVEFVASAATPLQLAGFSLDSSPSGKAEIQIGVGAAGSETVIASFRTSTDISLAVADRRLFVLSPPVSKIGQGDRVAVRLASDQGTATTAVVRLIYYDGLEDATDYTAAGYYAVPTGAAGVSVTPNSTAWANSAWAEVTSGLEGQAGIAAIVLDGPVNDLWYEIDLGEGPSGSETVLATVKAWKGSSEGVPLRLPALILVAPATRLAIRLRKEGTSTTAWTGGAVQYYQPLETDEATPEIGQSFGPLVWVEWESTDGTTRVWAPVDLPDPDGYYHGYKSPKLIMAGRVVRALSDEQGEYQGQTFDVTISDQDRDIRTLLGRTDDRRHLLNSRMVMRMISEADWRAKLTPRTVAIGQVRNYRLH
jgi:hypothetical protein